MIESQLVSSRLEVLDVLVNATISVGSQLDNLFVLDEVTVNLSIADFDFWVGDPSLNSASSLEDAPCGCAS